MCATCNSEDDTTVTPDVLSYGMRVWTDGEHHVVLGPQGLHVSARQSKLIKVAVPADGFERGWLAVHPGPDQIWAGVGGSTITLHDLNGSTPRAAQIAAVAVIDQRRVLAVIIRNGSPELVIAEQPMDRGPLDAQWARRAVTVPIDHATRVRWPASGAAVSWSQTLTPSLRWTMSHNECGVAAVDQVTGVLVVRQRQGQLRFLRVPSGLSIEAAATPQGVLVVHGDERSGALHHFDLEGTLLASSAIPGLSSELAVLPEEGLVVLAHSADDHSGKIDVRLLDLATLEPRGTVPTGLSVHRGAPTLHAAANRGGLVVVVGDGKTVKVLRRPGENESWQSTPLSGQPTTRSSTAPPRGTPARTAPRPTRARHASFGEGKIVEELPGGKLVIEFDTGERRMLLARMLEII